MELTTQPCHTKANSYYTLAQAETYLNNYDRISSSSDWNGHSDDVKKYALMLAARMMNTFNYKGIKCCKTQNLAFPRFSAYQVRYEGKKAYRDFFEATRASELKSIVSGGELSISNNMITDDSSSGDAFYSDYYYGNIYPGQLIKQSGLSCDTYLTIEYIPEDGSYLEIKETISDEDAPTGGVDIQALPLFGFPDEVGKAQAEIAMQTIENKIITGDITEGGGELQYSKINISGAISLSSGSWQSNKTTKLAAANVGAADIIYLLLGEWLSATGARLV